MSEQSQSDRDKVLQFLKGHSQPVSAEQISKALHISSRQVREAVWRLTAASQVEITEDWKLRRTGASAARQIPEPA